MVTLRDVATRAGVSIASASTVINRTAAVSPALRDRVERAVADLGYVPHDLARNLKLGRASAIGLVIPDITNPHFSGLASAIEDACDTAGYTLTLCSTTDNAAKEVRQLEALRRQRVAGVVFVPGGSANHDVAALTRLLKGPAVLLDRVLPGFALDAVVLDNIEAGRLAADHLLRQGHRRMAIVAGNPELGLSRDRVLGFLQALQAFGIEAAEAQVVDGAFQVAPTLAATLRLLGGQRPPTAIVAASNHAIVGVMKALATKGLRCPDDVSVVGIDDPAWADALRPRLTVVAQPIEEMGREAVRLLLDRAGSDAQGPPECLVMSPHLFVRDSTRPLRGDLA